MQRLVFLSPGALCRGILPLTATLVFACAGTTVTIDDSDAGDAAAVDAAGVDTGVSDASVAPPDASIPDSSVRDSAPDAADANVAEVHVPDVGTPDGIQCGSAKCAVGQVCCPSSLNGQITLSCAASCPSGNAIECDGPEDCAGKTCCGKTKTATGTFPNCPVSSASAKCDSSCGTSIAFSCAAETTVRLCHAKADCTEPSYSACCTYELGGNTSTFCTSPFLVGSAKSCAK